MKKIILLCVAFLSAIATFAQQDANRVFVFTDKDGNAFENGATIERDKLEFDDFEEFKQILSNVYVKQTATDKNYAVSMSVKINSIDNGTLQVCFPMSCLRLVKPGTSDLGTSTLSEAASYNKETGLASILTEWIPKSEDAWGKCEATFTLTTLIKKSFLDYTTVGKSSEITVQFVNRVPDKDTDISAHSDILYFDKTAGFAGSQVVLSLKMRNRLKAVSYQCDLYLPDGVEVAKNDDGSYKIELSTERTTVENNNVFESALQPDGCIRILSASTKDRAYNGNDGEVATIVLQLSDGLKEGDLPIILRNVEIADANSANNVIDFVKSTLTVLTYTVGDVNNDGKISITDFTAIVKYLMGNAPAGFIEMAADISGDGKISVTDLTSLVPLIMQGTNASPRHASPSMNSESAYAELSAADCFMDRGMECTVDVKVTGNYDFSAYQFDLDLPEGVRVKMQNGKPCVTLIKSRADDHLPNVFTSGIMPDGSLRVLGATTDGALVNKADGCIARITLVADRDAAYGLHNATVGNIVLAANGHDIEPEPTTFSISVGDATGIDGIDAGEECGDIYDVAGKMVKRNGTTKGLKQGIYIMNGKKILK